MNQTSAPMNFRSAAGRWLGARADGIDPAVGKVLQHAIDRAALTTDPNHTLDVQSTFGGRMADRIAAFGGSWLFIGLFGATLATWVTLNTEFLGKTAFDPYPYIFLNLMLSMLAAIQAPVILMSQNRQSVKDRQMAAYDYEVNLKAELEIMALHDKMDTWRTEQLAALIEHQQRSFEMLTKFIEARDLKNGV
jgi:uncharacterized membrane protein